MNRSVLLSTVAIGLSTVMLKAADWPQFRGPNRDGVSLETGLLTAWPANGPQLQWTYSEAGIGYSGPAVVGDRLYLTGGRGDEEVVFALEQATATDGHVKELWATKLGPLFNWKGNSWSAGPSATPTVDGERVYALSGLGDLACLETATGKELWRTNLPKNLDAQVNPIGGGPRNLGWGFTCSPLIDGNQLIVVPGGPKGTLAALDKLTGKVLWRSTELTDQAAYTSPVVTTIGGVKQYVILTNPGVAGVAASDGKLLWSHRRKSPYTTEVINTPIVQNGLIASTIASGNGGCELIRVEKDGDAFRVESVYANKNLMNHHGTVVLVGKHIYGATQGAGWVCQDFATGEIVWTERRSLGSGSVTVADGRLYCFAEGDGTIVLADASPTGWKETGRMKLPQASKLRKPQGKIWTPPVVAGGKLYLRDQELLLCFDVKAK